VRTLDRGVRVVGCGVLAAAAGLACMHLAGAPVDPGVRVTTAGLAVAVAVLAGSLWWTSRDLLRQVVADVGRLRPRPAVS
jgi:hypothetical protein